MIYLGIGLTLKMKSLGTMSFQNNMNIGYSVIEFESKVEADDYRAKMKSFNALRYILIIKELDLEDLNMALLD